VGTDKVLIGAPDFLGEQGAAYLFSASGALLCTFTNPFHGNSYFGSAMSAVGTDTVLIGDAQNGQAYLYRTDGPNGTLLTTFTNPVTGFGDFGIALAAVGSDKVLIGADFTGQNLEGMAFLFSTNGTLLTIFTNPVPTFASRFGFAVAAVGTDRVLVTQVEAAYLFSTNGTLLATFTRPNPASVDYFGYAVAVVGTDKVLVAAPYDDTGATAAGAAYLFHVPGPAFLVSRASVTVMEGSTANVTVQAVNTPFPMALLELQASSVPLPFATLAGIVFSNTAETGLATGTLQLSPAYGDAGSYTITLRAVDDLGNSATFDISVTVVPRSGIGITRWKDPVSGNWSDSSKWSGGLPDSTTAAVIDIAGVYTVTNDTSVGIAGLTLGGSSGAQTLDVNGQQLFLNGTSFVRTNATLNLSNSDLGGGNVTVSGTLKWSSGTLDTGGELIVASGGTAILTGDGEKALYRNLRNRGTVLYDGRFLAFNPVLFPASIENEAGATFIVAGSGNFSQDSAGNNAFNNSGLFIKRNAAATSFAAGVAFNNNGGTVSLEAGAGTLQYAGVFTLATTGTITNPANNLSICTFLNSGGTIIGFPPFVFCHTNQITAPPQSQTVNPGQDATFTVSAISDAPLSYQWRFNGADISGATDTSYTRANVQPADEGSYTVVVTSTAGSVTSAVATLTDAGDIILDNINPPSNVAFTGAWQIGTSASSRFGPDYRFALAVPGAGTSNAIYRPNILVAGDYDVYVWYAQGGNRATNAPWLVSYNGGSVLVPVNQRINGGRWLLIASSRNFAAGTTGFVQLSNGGNETGGNQVVIADAARFTYSTIQGLPSINVQPQSQTVNAGQDATFSVSAVGAGPLGYQWLFNGAIIPGATGAAFPRATAQVPDAGGYSVVVANSLGSATSAVATLSVNFSLTLTATAGGSASKNPDQAGYAPGSSVALTAVAGPSFAFTGWSGDASGTANPLTVTMTTNLAITANFASTDLIVDNIDPEVTTNAPWAVGADAPGHYGENYYFASTVAGAATFIATYTPNIIVPGDYDVYLYYPAGGSQAINAPWLISDNEGAVLAPVNQQINGGNWFLIASGRNFAPGAAGSVRLSNDTGAGGSVVIADAVRFKYSAVQGRPYIDQQPQSQTLAAGSAATFTVVARSSAALSYQWRLNGSDIAGATGTSYTRGNVHAADAGGYSVLVATASGSETSAAAALSTTDCAPPGNVAWWPAEGQANDVIGGHNGTLEGAAAFANGESGQGFLFNGVSGGVNLGDVPTFNFTQADSFSIAAWFKNFGQTSDGQAIVTLNYNCSPSSQIVAISGPGPDAGKVVFTIRDANGVSTDLFSPAAVTLNQFHYVVAVREVSGASKKLRLYVDGVQADTANDPTTGALSGGDPDWIGRRNSCPTDWVFNGIIDEVAVFNRALSSDEIAAVYHAGAGGLCQATRSIQFIAPTTVSVLEGSTADVPIQAYNSIYPMASLELDPSSDPAPFLSLNGVALNNPANGGLISGTLQLSPAYGEASAGNYHITLRATDNHGDVATFDLRVNVIRDSSIGITRWINLSGGSWSDPNNWSDGLPDSTTAAVIDVPGNYLVVLDTSPTIAGLTLGASSGNEVLLCNGRTLTLNGTSVVHAKGVLDLFGSTLAGSGNLSISGLLNWPGGILQAGGELIVASGGTANLTDGYKYLYRTFRNRGMVKYTGDDLYFNSDSSVGRIENEAGATFITDGSGSFRQGVGGNSVFNNAGRFIKRNAANTFFAAGVPFNNNNGGIVNIEEGTLEFHTGGNYGGTINGLGGTDPTMNGRLLLTGGSHNLNVGGLLNQGALTINGVTLNLNSASAINFTNLDAGGSTVNLGFDYALTNLTLGSSTLAGSNVTVSGTFNWSSGVLEAGGELIVGGTANLTEGSTKYLYRTLRNRGMVKYTGSALYFNSDSSVGRIENEAGATFIADGSGSFSLSSPGNSVFNNAGLFIKTNAANTLFAAGVPFNNNGGTVNIEEGTLLYAGVFTLSTTGAITNPANNLSICTFLNSGGTIVGNPPVVTCNSLQITAQPQSQIVNAGQDATFTVSATGDAPLSYQWRFNGTNIFAATASSYARNQAQSTDAGPYSVTVANAAGAVTSAEANLTVQQSVSIQILSVQLIGEDVRLDWTTVGGHSYVVQAGPEVMGSFLDVSPAIAVGGTGAGTTNYTHIGGATNPAAFYRVRLGP
jgi:hypothetical protein